MKCQSTAKSNNLNEPQSILLLEESLAQKALVVGHFHFS
jgi:hypothetical protein